MPERAETASRKLLRRLRDSLAEPGKGQERLDRITGIIAAEMGTDVCSIYLMRDAETLELCATEGLNPEAVHRTRLRVGEGLVGRVARDARSLNTGEAAGERGFRYMPETGEDLFRSFLGVPIQRLGERLGVLVVQSRAPRQFSEDEVYGLEVVAMVIAEMAELGTFVGEGAALSAPHQRPQSFPGMSGQEGAAAGHVWLHDPRAMITDPVADDPAAELERLDAALAELRTSIETVLDGSGLGAEEAQVMEAYRMFAHSRGWRARMREDIERGLSAEAAVEKEQSAARARLRTVPDAYLRERLQDIDDLSNRLLRHLMGQNTEENGELPPDPILVARNIGPGDLLSYGRKLKGVVLEDGAVGSHAAIVARALAIPLVVQAQGITAEALNGDPILVDGDQGMVHLRPEESVATAFHDKVAMQARAQARYASIRDKPAETRDGTRVTLTMNAGLMADLPSLESSGAEGVGLFRTELQFLIRNRMPKRGELVEIYRRVMAAAKGSRVVFRTLDIGSDKVLPYLKREDEPNPALGWRAIRVGLDRGAVMRMQIQALIRAAGGARLAIMLPFVAEPAEYDAARAIILREIERERHLGHPLPETLEIGTMLEVPALARAPASFFERVDFVSVGGNDLKQFFFAADRENERVRRRYDTLSPAFLEFLEHIVGRVGAAGTPLSFCGEDAGRPVEAVALTALGFRALSMRPASIGPVKNMLRRIDLSEARRVLDAARTSGAASARPALMDWLQSRG